MQDAEKIVIEVAIDYEDCKILLLGSRSSGVASEVIDESTARILGKLYISTLKKFCEISVAEASKRFGLL